MTEIQIGDKVRVSYEGVVEWAEGSYLHFGDATLDNTTGFTVDVLEKAKPKDDPRNDLVGTIRQGNRGPWVKVWHNEWRLANGIQSDVLGDYVFVPDWHPVIGVVPGSLAAKAQEAREAAPALTKFKVGQRIKGGHGGFFREGIIQKTEEHCRTCAEKDLSGDMYLVDSGLISYESAELVDPWAKFQD